MRGIRVRDLRRRLGRASQREHRWYRKFYLLSNGTYTYPASVQPAKWVKHYKKCDQRRRKAGEAKKKPHGLVKIGSSLAEVQRKIDEARSTGDLSPLKSE